MKAIAGSIVMLTGGILFSSGVLAIDSGWSAAGFIPGALIGLIGFAILAGWIRIPGDDDT